MGIIDLFATNLKNLMTERDWTSVDVANHCDLSSAYIRLLLNKKRQPTITALEQVAKAFGLEGWQLIVKGSAASEDVTRLVRAYQHSDEGEREALLRLAESAASR